MRNERDTEWMIVGSEWLGKDDELTKVLREEFKSSLPTVEKIESELSE